MGDERKVYEKIEKKFADLKNRRIFAVLFREHSSVGLEHLPYKQRVGGSTPSAPTKSLSDFWKAFFFLCMFIYLDQDLSGPWAQSGRSEPFGRARAACFERSAGVLADCDAAALSVRK